MADDKAQGFWTSIPGMLTALAAVITATAGLLTVLKQQPDKANATPGGHRASQGPKASPGPVKPADAAPVAQGGTGGPAATQNGTQTATPSATPNVFDVLSVTPAVAAPLPVGQPVQVSVSVRYKLATATEAVFGVYLEEFPAGDSTCSGNVHHTNGGKLVPVNSQSTSFQVNLKWQRKPGDAYKSGGPADHGFLSVGSNLWQDSTGRAGTLIHPFGTSPTVCIPYG